MAKQANIDEIKQREVVEWRRTYLASTAYIHSRYLEREAA
jgi:hypothetical protein